MVMFFYPNQAVVSSHGVGRVICHDYSTKLVHVLHRNSKHSWQVKKHHQDDIQAFEGFIWTTNEAFASKHNSYVQYYRYT